MGGERHGDRRASWDRGMPPATRSPSLWGPVSQSRTLPFEALVKSLECLAAPNSAPYSQPHPGYTPPSPLSPPPLVAPTLPLVTPS
ncbi:hypothetical protein PBY51_017390 [Eleginops maclovinus]|uniref:Uncharacterized protein n=1 Tax=Eleginops maclovinus TaxID=56733 RepID=A0AAN7XJM8_ELEMC|nr:hypothetical protein PBY51_017390 [Eleginops maclovinus]